MEKLLQNREAQMLSTIAVALFQIEEIMLAHNYREKQLNSPHFNYQ